MTAEQQNSEYQVLKNWPSLTEPLRWRTKEEGREKHARRTIEALHFHHFHHFHRQAPQQDQGGVNQSQVVPGPGLDSRTLYCTVE